MAFVEKAQAFAVEREQTLQVRVVGFWQRLVVVLLGQVLGAADRPLDRVGESLDLAQDTIQVVELHTAC